MADKKINDIRTNAYPIMIKVSYLKGKPLTKEEKRVGEIKRELFLNKMAEIIRKYGNLVLK